MSFQLSDFSDDANPSDINDEILSMHMSKNTIIFGLYTQLSEFELHLDTITTRYKNLALTWLLATYAAVGFLFSVESKNIQISSSLIASIVCLFGVFGIAALWFLDIYVLQKFWGAFFIEEVKMEKRFRFLAKITNVSISLNNVRKRIIGHSNFYMFAILLLLITSGATLTFVFASYLIKLIIVIFLIAIILLVYNLMYKVATKLQKRIERLTSIKKT